MLDQYPLFRVAKGTICSTSTNRHLEWDSDKTKATGLQRNEMLPRKSEVKRKMQEANDGILKASISDLR